jgi:hypothetical protein
MESVAPPLSLWIDKALIPIVGAATSQRLFFFNLTISLVSLKHKNTRTHTNQGRRQGFAKNHSLGDNGVYIVSLPLTAAFSLLNAKYIYIS